MIKFHVLDENPFDYVVKIVLNNKTFDTEILYQRTENIPEALKNIGLFCFPYKKFQSKRQITFMSSFTDSSKNILYCYVAQKQSVAYSVVSRFYHPKFYETVSQLFVGISGIQAPDILLQFSDINHGKYNWTIETKDHTLTNLSPSNELCRLYSFIFTKLPIRSILATIVAMLLDCRIVVISSNLSHLSDAAFSILSFIYPIEWPLTFIPILPQSLFTTLEAPFGYLIGIHSSYSHYLLDIDRYFVVNIDAHYTAVVGMEDFPDRISNFIEERSNTIENILSECSPIFPFLLIQKEIRRFVRDMFGVTFSIENSEHIHEIITQFNKWKTIPSEEFTALFSQTQLVTRIIDAIEFEPNEEIFHAFWPHNVFIKKSDVVQPSAKAKPLSSTPTLLAPLSMSPGHFGLASNRKNSINKSSLSLGLETILSMKDDSDGILEEVIREQQKQEKKEKQVETNDDSTSGMTVLTKISSGPFYFAASTSSDSSNEDEPIVLKRTLKRNDTGFELDQPTLIEQNGTAPANTRSSMPNFNSTIEKHRSHHKRSQGHDQASSSEFSSQESSSTFTSLEKSTYKPTFSISSRSTLKNEEDEQHEDELKPTHRHSQKVRKRKSKAKSQFGNINSNTTSLPEKPEPKSATNPLPPPKLFPPLPLANIRKSPSDHNSSRPFIRNPVIIMTTPSYNNKAEVNDKPSIESTGSKPPIIRQRLLISQPMKQRRRFSKPSLHQAYMANSDSENPNENKRAFHVPNIVFDDSYSESSYEESQNNDVDTNDQINQSKVDSKLGDSDNFVNLPPKIKTHKSNLDIHFHLKANTEGGVMKTRNVITPRLNRNIRRSVANKTKSPTIHIELSSSSSESEDT